MDTQMIMLSGGLLGLIIVNIVLGAVNSIFDKTFGKDKLVQGIIKGGIVTGCFIATYFIGSVNPDVIVMKVNEVDVNLLTAVYITVLGAFVSYGGQVVQKLAGYVAVKK